MLQHGSPFTSLKGGIWKPWSPSCSTASSGGSILLLAALGLALTFGQMGVINMAHGEFIMAGAYTAFVTQQLLGSRRAVAAGRRCRSRSWSAVCSACCWR